jgi:PPK2 family polyphosphate:nucleotide phosphotransferase
MKIDLKDFQARIGKKTELKKWPTSVHPVYGSKKEYQRLIDEQVQALSALQNVHYASGHYAVLFIFQAMDAAGKDGTIRHVMSGVDPQGCQVFSFKQPSAEELQHDFLWRTTRCLPERGRIGIFNRSYYEEVLIVRVHPELLQAQGIPAETASDRKFWKGRYHSIVQFENHLHRNGTRVLKFFLHLSREEQRKRFLQRIDDPQKNWKFSEADIRERKYWKHYMAAYEECIEETSSDNAPWYIIPADDKENARLIVSQIAVETLQELKASYPRTPPRRKKELQSFKALLEKERQI